jgi:3-oxoacyl-[acyl-carrier-protein] synthase III
VIGSVRENGTRVGITGVGAYVPERVLTNADLEQMVDTNDEWIVERTGIRERRIADESQAASDLALPACRQALERAGIAAEEVDYIVVATATPDMIFPATSCVVADELGATRAAAYDLLAGCSGFVYALAQAYGAVAGGLSECALVVGSETLSKITNWDDRGTCIIFGDGAGAAVVERVDEGGFEGFELGADGSRGPDLCVPAGGSRLPATTENLEREAQFIHMNGREVYRFATRIMVSSGRDLLERCGFELDEVDLYVPHQANKRIIEHAAKDMGLPEDRIVLNIDRYGNTSSASIPLALAEAEDDGRLKAGSVVLMTAVGAGLTWGSVVLTWTDGARS